ncbi:MAG: cupin domain-containing protein [Nannocystaceae bacterium]
MILSWLEPTTPGQAIAAAELDRVGVLHERLELAEDDFQPALDRLKAARGYVAQDIIDLTPETPNLEALCAKFAPEHLHTDDEVRFILRGEGIFDVRSADDRWMRIEVFAGDLLVVPAHCHHRFFLTDRRQIRAVRLFKDSSGWTPVYR